MALYIVGKLSDRLIRIFRFPNNQKYQRAAIDELTDQRVVIDKLKGQQVAINVLMDQRVTKDEVKGTWASRDD